MEFDQSRDRLIDCHRIPWGKPLHRFGRGKNLVSRSENDHLGPPWRRDVCFAGQLGRMVQDGTSLRYL